MDQGRIIAVVGKNSGRAIVKNLWERGANLTDVFVKDERYRINGSGFRTFDDLFNTEEREKTRLHKVGYIRNHIELLREVSPDLLIMNFSEILGKEILEIPSYGVVGFHYAPLPNRRGCNPDIWAVIHGLEESRVTLHYYNERIDEGDIVDSEPFRIDFKDDAQDVLDKINKSVVTLLDRNLEGLVTGNTPRTKQSGRGIYTPRRTFEDGEISWPKMKAIDIYNIIRALRPPYGGAFSLCGPKGEKEKLYIMRGEIVEGESSIREGDIIDWKMPREEIHKKILDRGMGYSLTGNGIIKITETRIEGIER